MNWVKGIGGPLEQKATSIATDFSGNVYVAGYFYGETDFDPSISEGLLIGTENFYDSYFAKYDTNGNYIYVKSIEGNNDVQIRDLAIDNQGNICITGIFRGDVDFNPSEVANAYISSTLGYYDMFFAKYDTDGNYLFAKNIGGTSGFEKSNTIAVDSDRNIYIGGGFWSSANFQTQPGEEAILESESDPGAMNAFIAKYDEYGNYVFARNVARGQDNSIVNSIGIDLNGYILLTGHFRGTADFNPLYFLTFNLISAGESDIFLSKLTSEGAFVFAKSMGGTSADYGNDLALDTVGNVYITGSFYDSAVFGNESNSPVSITGEGGRDFLFCKYSSVGDFEFVRSTGGSGQDEGVSILVDANGVIYVSGTFSGSIDFDNLTFITAVDIYESAGLRDVFLARYSNATGQYLDGHHMGGVEDDFVSGIASDNSGNILIAGAFSSTADFSTNAENELLTCQGEEDIFIAKYAFGFASTSLDQIENEKYNLFPNPLIENVTLTLGEHHSFRQAIVTDISGRVLNTFILNSDLSSQQLNLSSLNPGYYILHCKGSKNDLTLKFIKQ